MAANLFWVILLSNKNFHFSSPKLPGRGGLRPMVEKNSKKIEKIFTLQNSFLDHFRHFWKNLKKFFEKFFMTDRAKNHVPEPTKIVKKFFSKFFQNGGFSVILARKSKKEFIEVIESFLRSFGEIQKFLNISLIIGPIKAILRFQLIFKGLYLSKLKMRF